MYLVYILILCIMDVFITAFEVVFARFGDSNSMFPDSLASAGTEPTSIWPNSGYLSCGAAVRV